ncbi:MAG: DUF418 domain-containing protein [Sphingomonadaceae bacterium]
MSASDHRLISLDAIRGFAVMGILLMNIIAFAMPQGAYIDPSVYGGTSTADLISWAIMSVFVDGKMRGLFSILFGASMLLVYERAEATHGNGTKVHRARMIWLLIFGAIHYYFIWFGDILTTYALCGLVGMILLLLDEAQLRRAAIWLMGISIAISGLPFLAMWGYRFMVSAASRNAGLATLMAELSQHDASTSRAAIALHHGPYVNMAADRMTEGFFDPVVQFIASGPETLGLMAIGMLLLRNGFLTGTWDDARYTRAMMISYAIGLPVSALLTLWSWGSGFDPLVTLGNAIAWSLPFHVATMIGHAAFLIMVIRRWRNTPIIKRVAATGQAAFTNYLGTSILMIWLFDGHGLAWFGTLSRWQAYLVVPFVWALMLLWSKPWLDRYRYGPLEWLWRSLARGEMQTMRR